KRRKRNEKEPDALPKTNQRAAPNITTILHAWPRNLIDGAIDFSDGFTNICSYSSNTEDASAFRDHNVIRFRCSSMEHHAVFPGSQGFKPRDRRASFISPRVS